MANPWRTGQASIQQRPTKKEHLASAVRQIAKRILPESVLAEMRRYRKYKSHERRVYTKLKFMDVVGLNRQRERRPRNGSSFLFVCFGNIMRSPMCERLMKNVLRQQPALKISVASAGLNAVPGRSAHPWSITAARDFGVSLADHTARLLTVEMVKQVEVIFAMDYQNLVELHCRYPFAKQKFFMLSAYAGNDYLSSEIRDPFYGNEEQTRSCYRILQTCIENLVSELAQKTAKNSKAGHVVEASPTGV